MNIRKNFSKVLMLLSIIATQATASNIGENGGLPPFESSTSPSFLKNVFEEAQPDPYLLLSTIRNEGIISEENIRDARIVITGQNAEKELYAEITNPRGLGTAAKFDVQDKLQVAPAQGCVFRFFTDNELPEVLYQILRLLPLKDLTACASVNKNLRAFLSEPLRIAKSLHSAVRLKNNVEEKYKKWFDINRLQVAIEFESAERFKSILKLMPICLGEYGSKIDLNQSTFLPFEYPKQDRTLGQKHLFSPTKIEFPELDLSAERFFNKG